MSRPMGPGPGGRGRVMHATRKPKDTKKTLKQLFGCIFKNYKLHFLAVTVFIIINAIAGVKGSLFIQTLIDDYVEPMLRSGSRDFTPLITALFTMAGIYAAGVIAAFLQNRIMIVVGQGVLKEIRDNMFSKMQTLPIRYFDTHSHGDTMSRYTNDTDTLRQMITMSIPQMFSSVVTVVSVLIAMLSTSIWLTVVVLALVGLALFVSRNITGKSSKFFVAQQKSLGEVNGFIEEHINGQKVVKVFCHERATKDEFDKINEELCYNATAAHTFANILMPIMGNMGHMQYVLLAMAGGALAISGVPGVTVGVIAAFLQLSKSFTMPINQMSQQINSIIMALAGAERIFELIETEPEEDNGYVTLVNAEYNGDELCETEKRTGIWAWKHPHSDGTVTYTRLAGDVRLAEVDFGYTEEKTVLHDISIYAEPGQKIAFVGATGAGKTTITNLLNRFYDIADGKIRYDGININKIKKPELRRALGMVLQDTHLFTGTVMENIRYGRLDATDEDVYAAAKLANADSFIRILPEGYNTILKNGGEGLSQGQRQLLAIARAAVADPPVMILDEATSSIDTRTEQIVQKGMDSLMQGRTVFVIAHRLSTIQDSDVIMVMDHGRIIERGDHDKLIAEKGTYYKLYTGAFENTDE
ncbi:MAG: ABC transporter ATP-binding protein [Ruminococcaceae bacterium]|nr:ABC transporter ATP-binding protein [Oscillospiraceae bacterium]